MGSVARRSARMNAAIITADRSRKPTTCGEPHSYWEPAHDRAIMSGTMDRTRVTIPATSSLVPEVDVRLAGKNRLKSTSAAMPSGTLT